CQLMSCVFHNKRLIGERCKMPTQIIPAASHRSTERLPAARTPFRTANYLIYWRLWLIRRTIFQRRSEFLPALREARAGRGDHCFEPESSRIQVNPIPHLSTNRSWLVVKGDAALRRIFQRLSDIQGP